MVAAFIGGETGRTLLSLMRVHNNPDTEVLGL